jgi:hypothetical protein
MYAPYAAQGTRVPPSRYLQDHAALWMHQAQTFFSDIHPEIQE